MRVERVKRHDGGIGYKSGNFIHSNERMAEIGLPFAIQRERERLDRSRRTLEEKLPKINKTDFFLSAEDRALLYGSSEEKPRVVPVENFVIQGAEFTPEELRQVRRIKAALASKPEQFEKVKRFILDFKRKTAFLDVELNREAASKIIGQCL